MCLFFFKLKNQRNFLANTVFMCTDATCFFQICLFFATRVFLAEPYLSLFAMSRGGGLLFVAAQTFHCSSFSCGAQALSRTWGLQ